MRPNLRTHILLCGLFTILAGGRNPCLAQASDQANSITVTLTPASFTTAKMLDIVYAKPLCSNAVNGHPSPIASTLFLSDNIDAPGIVLAFPKTYVNNVYGGLDTSSAVPEGLLWYDQISSQKAQSCVADAPHPVPDVEDGAIQIANDIISLCKLQP